MQGVLDTMRVLVLREEDCFEGMGPARVGAWLEAGGGKFSRDVDIRALRTTFHLSGSLSLLCLILAPVHPRPRRAFFELACKSVNTRSACASPPPPPTHTHTTTLPPVSPELLRALALREVEKMRTLQETGTAAEVVRGRSDSAAMQLSLAVRYVDRRRELLYLAHRTTLFLCHSSRLDLDSVDSLIWGAGTRLPCGAMQRLRALRWRACGGGSVEAYSSEYRDFFLGKQGSQGRTSIRSCVGTGPRPYGVRPVTR